MLKKCSLIFSLLLFLLCGVERLYYYQHGGFCLSKVISDLKEEFPSTHELPSLEIQTLLEQPFHFIGSGGTCFAFLGADQKTVLKLFKHQHLTSHSLLWHIAFPLSVDIWRLKKILLKEKEHNHKRLPFFFGSCALADEKLKEQTATLYLSLKKNTLINQTVQLVDQWGFTHTLSLRDTEFALQEHAELLFSYFQKHLSAGNLEKCKSGIDSLLSLILQRCALGIGDRDPNLQINFGFVEDRAVEIDIGSFFYDPQLLSPFKQIQELFLCTQALQKWLDKQSPELLHYLREQILKYHDAFHQTAA
ncbi:MAG: hypothetical protein V4492_03300 [Chlamydiota bacterium]